MSSIFMILILTLLQFFTGFGLISLFKLKLPPALFIPLAVLLGIAVFSIAPFVLQLIYVPLTATNIFITLIVLCIGLNIKFRKGGKNFIESLRNKKFRIRLYEAPFLLLLAFIIFVSVWRCFYFPPYPRDVTSGAEVIAEYAVKEKTMINSVFSVDLETTNNQFKPPFVTSLQVIYKYAGFPFGQIWLSIIFISFIIFLYHAVSLKIHRLLAGIVLLFFIAVPEMYAYTFMILFDYSNAVFFFLAIYFLIEYFKIKQNNYIAFAGLLLGFATYMRSETLVLGCFTAIALLCYHIRNWNSLTKIIQTGILFLLPSVLFYLLPVSIYINYYLPEHYTIEGLINPHLSNLKPLYHRFVNINASLIFSQNGIHYYGYLFFVFIAVLLFDVSLKERMKMETRNWLYAVLVIYAGLPVLGYLLPLLDLDNSTKRGLFKIFPLLLLYMANSRLLIGITEKIKDWERK